MKLSIIIPVYNAEQYLQKCLESVFNQNLSPQDYEILCINDGSTDASLSILNKFQEGNANLKVVSTENKGPAHARNRGLENAKGKYITFLDSDDQMYPNTLSEILNKLEEEGIEILYPMIHFFDEKDNLLEKSKIENNSKINTGLLQERRTLPATFYKRELVREIRFPEEVLVGEDTVFNAKVQSKAQRVYFEEIPYYKYVVRPNSLSKKAITEEGYQGFINAITILDEYKNQHFSTENKEAQQYFDKVILVFVTRIVELHILPNLYQPKYKELKKLLSEKGYWHLAKTIAEKYPYFDTSFSKMARHQKKLIFKTKVYQLLQKIKKL